MTPGNGTLRVAVLSDLHAYVPPCDGTAPSYLSTADPEDQPHVHPVAGLLKLVGDDNLQADLLCCAGDIGDKANPTAINWAWERVHKIAQALGARTIATAGNHDIDSRYAYNDFDARGVLQGLVAPRFPVDNRRICDEYWSRHYAIIVEPPYRVVLLNSAAYHGDGHPETPEYNQGRVSERTVGRLFEDLASTDPQPINLLLCHHHLFRFGDIDLVDYSEMLNGHLLLERLAEDGSRWMVIHGHKHFARIAYAQGGSTSPVVLAAGSFSATLHPGVQTRTSNQFYILDYPFSRFTALGLPLAGTFTAWQWSHGRGWHLAPTDGELPGRGGFGCRDDPIAVAADVDSLLTPGTAYVEWQDVLARYPRYAFLLPRDFSEVLRQAQKRGLAVQGTGYDAQFSRP